MKSKKWPPYSSRVSSPNGTHRTGPWNPLGPPHGIPGEVVSARVFNPHEDENSIGKVRPVVIVRRVDGHFVTVGLTRRTTFVDGITPRQPIPHPEAIGLNGPGFLWGTLTNVSVLDAYHHIGYVDPSLALQIRMGFNLGRDIVDAIDITAFSHHAAPLIG